MTKKQAGRLGGKATFKKYGKEYMSKIGKQGADKTWSLYMLRPFGTFQFAMVRRSDNVIVAYTAYHK